MAITAFNQIPGLVGAGCAYLGGWDAEASQPTIDANTGEVTSLGTELSGNSTMALAVSDTASIKPRWATDPKGLLLLGRHEVADVDRGMGIRFTPTTGLVYQNTKILAVVCATFTNMGGDFKGNTIQRLVATNFATGAFCLQKVNAVGTVTDAGRTQVNGGGSLSTVTSTRSGCEKQILSAFQTYSSPNGAKAYLNGAGASGLGAGALLTVPSFTVGFMEGSGVTGKQNGPTHGIIHSVHLYAIDTVAGAGSNFSEANMIDAVNLLAGSTISVPGTAAGWNVTLTPTECHSVMGNSIEYGSGTDHDEVPNTAESGHVNTTLSADISAFVNAIPVVERTGFLSGGNGGSGKYIIDPGKSNAEVVTVTNGAQSNAGSLTISGNTRFAHTSGAVICGSGYGYINPQNSCWNRSKKVGNANVKLFNFAQPSSLLSTVASTNPSPDGSTQVFDSVSGRKTAWGIRHGNDFNSGSSAATVLGLYADSGKWVANARNPTGYTAPNKIILGECLHRGYWSAGNNGIVDTFNASLTTAATGADAICRFTEHPLLGDTVNEGYLTVTGCVNQTTIIGQIFDPPRVHPRRMGQCAMAFAIDKAYAAAWNEAVGYTPTALVCSGTPEAAGIRLSWTAPTSPNAPHVIGDTTSGASCLVVRIKKNGTKLVWIAPATINANTGAATYTLEYLDETYSYGDTYTVEVVDAVGNTSGEAAVTLIQGGEGAVEVFRIVYKFRSQTATGGKLTWTDTANLNARDDACAVITETAPGGGSSSQVLTLRPDAGSYFSSADVLVGAKVIAPANVFSSDDGGAEITLKLNGIAGGLTYTGFENDESNGSVEWGNGTSTNPLGLVLAQINAGTSEILAEAIPSDVLTPSFRVDDTFNLDCVIVRLVVTRHAPRAPGGLVNWMAIADELGIV